MTWWTTDPYDDSNPLPEGIVKAAGPEGVALVRLNKDGSTDPGWGVMRPGDEDETTKFMWKYQHGAFREFPILWGFQQRRWNFAIVMRSVKLVCIDIDGKNGGLANIGKLGMLPYTLAETSKSGNGYHLIYATSEDEWDNELGFALFQDRINLEQGVDFRATGCVYHYAQQRWNGREIVELPIHLKRRLQAHSQQAAAQIAAIAKTIETGDPDLIAIDQDKLKDDLKKPIQSGRRNQTLFAIGQQMKIGQVPGWQKLVFDRAMQVGLDTTEANKIIANINKYGGN